jgi:hypothetical protein
MRALSLVLFLCGACHNDSVSSDQEAQLAYLGLDPHVDKAIQLGFDGFNSASSANISPQMTTGTLSGTLTVTGQVDQGASANKGMRLVEALVGYSDVKDYTYDTTTAMEPALTMQLKMIPTGTLSGTLAGTYTMSGMLEGSVDLSLSFTGQLMAGMGSVVARAPGTTHVTGTATSKYGTYNVDVTR